MSKDSAVRLAVLLDGENLSAAIADRLFLEIKALGNADIRRIYGDFSQGRLAGWADAIERYAIVQHHQRPYVSDKNASDIALVIDAMDLLHSGHVDGFCLVSSDSDFTPLALHIREYGLKVYGFGEEKTVQSFRRACHRFICIKAAGEPSAPTAKAVQIRSRLPEHALPTISNAIQNCCGEDGWASLTAIGQELRTLNVSFKCGDYGSASLSKLAKRIDALELRAASDGKTMQLRVKPKANRQTSNPAKPGPAPESKAA